MRAADGEGDREVARAQAAALDVAGGRMERVSSFALGARQASQFGRMAGMHGCAVQNEVTA